MLAGLGLTTAARLAASGGVRNARLRGAHRDAARSCPVRRADHDQSRRCQPVQVAIAAADRFSLERHKTLRRLATAKAADRDEEIDPIRHAGRNCLQPSDACRVL